MKRAHEVTATVERWSDASAEDIARSLVAHLDATRLATASPLFAEDRKFRIAIRVEVVE